MKWIDRTGQKVGFLTVSRHVSGDVSGWQVECACGETPILSAKALQNKYKKGNEFACCGPTCPIGRVAVSLKTQLRKLEGRPNLVGKTYGLLTCVAKLGYQEHRGKLGTVYRFECACGAEIECPDYEICNNKSGSPVRRSCSRTCKERRRRLQETRWQGQAFGDLIAIEPVMGHHVSSKGNLWKLRCSCGEVVWRHLVPLRVQLRLGQRVTCGDVHKHPLWLRFPPTPDPYPPESWEVVERYLHLCSFASSSSRIGSSIEDGRKDKLIRLGWTIVYRRQQGQEIDREHEERLVKKSLFRGARACYLRGSRQKIKGPKVGPRPPQPYTQGAAPPTRTKTMLRFLSR